MGMQFPIYVATFFLLQFQVERKFLEQYMGLVQVIRTNLPRFIDYMKSKSTQ